jgi:CHASE1-domain containing sensor protein
MDQRETAFLRRTTRLSSAVLVLLGLVGVLISAFLARREAEQYEALERLHIAQAVDTHFSAVQDHLALRENLANVVAALFIPPPLGTPRALGNFGIQVISLVPDIATAGWLPEVDKSRAVEALKALADSGVENPRFVDGNGQTIAPERLNRPLYPIMDIAPEKNRFVLGVDAGAFPDRLEAIRRARERRSVAGTAPLRLVQAPESTALLLYAPVYAHDGGFIGVLGFGYQVEKLLLSALSVPAPRPDFDIRVFTVNILD